MKTSGGDLKKWKNIPEASNKTAVELSMMLFLKEMMEILYSSLSSNILSIIQEKPAAGDNVT